MVGFDEMKNPNIFWKMVYKYYPPLLRGLERFRIHHHRQDFLLGHLVIGKSHDELKLSLNQIGYEDVILAWRDPGEILSMRLIDPDPGRSIYQYHFRLFSDGEMRCHYEFSSEGNPIGHVLEIGFESRPEIFHAHLVGYINPKSSN